MRCRAVPAGPSRRGPGLTAGQGAGVSAIAEHAPAGLQLRPRPAAVTDPEVDRLAGEMADKKIDPYSAVEALLSDK